MTIEQVNKAIVNGTPIVHTYMGYSIVYTLSGVITRYSKEKGWTYSLELIDKKSGCVVIASLEDCTEEVKQ